MTLTIRMVDQMGEMIGDPVLHPPFNKADTAKLAQTARDKRVEGLARLMASDQFGDPEKQVTQGLVPAMWTPAGAVVNLEFIHPLPVWKYFLKLAEAAINYADRTNPNTGDTDVHA